MPDAFPRTKAALTAAIDEAWAELQGFLGSLTEENAARRDDSGWSIKDHLTHLAVWEDSVTVLFRGRPRHEALGIEESFYREATFDQINAILKDRFSHLPFAGALTLLTRSHDALMPQVRSLSETQLGKAVCDFFPQAPRNDDRRMIDFIYWNTGDHFKEHLPWMRRLAGGAG